MKYREQVVEILKIVGQELMERADELVPDAKYVTDTDIFIHIPTDTDELTIPEISVTCNVFPVRTTVEKIIDIYNRRSSNENYTGRLGDSDSDQ